MKKEMYIITKTEQQAKLWIRSVLWSLWSMNVFYK